MDKNDEYHDPDYPDKPICIKEEVQSVHKEDKIEKIKQIVRREFAKELEARENEVMQIDQRMIKARRYLHHIRYSVVNSYYSNQKLQLQSSQIVDDVAAQTDPRARAEVSSMLRDSQPRIHPSVLKLLGKKSVDVEEIFCSRARRTKTRKNYLAMVEAKNVTIAADETVSLRPDRGEPSPERPSTSRPGKVPRHIEPRVENVLTLDEVTRNKMKHRYRIIIGNTSKYAPAASRADRSTHKWLLYVRGPPGRPELGALVTAVHVRLHPSYAPHHVLRLEKPPFHISRRGWGEFPAKVELHFPLPDRNRPAFVEHTIKLDRNYTGLQTLGAETIVDVWLYSTPEMLKYEYKEDGEEQTKKEVEMKAEECTEELVSNQNDGWLDFFSKGTTELNVDEMLIKTENNITSPRKDKIDPLSIKQECTEDVANGLDSDNVPNIPYELPTEITKSPNKKRIMKYMDPTTGKIYYLEMDRSLDLSTVQGIVINSKGNTKTAKISPIKHNGVRNLKKKTGVSLLKPEVKSELRSEVRSDKANINHIENDHCYLGSKWLCDNKTQFKVPGIKEEASAIDTLKCTINRFTCVRVTVSYLLKKIPLISDEARDLDYLKHFPFVVESADRYWKLDFAKRRNIEWSRAKFINRILLEKYSAEPERVWRTKQILMYSRLHGYFPVRAERSGDAEWSSWSDLDASRFEANIKEMYPDASDLSSLSIFNEEELGPFDSVNVAESDEDVDVVSDGRRVGVKREAEPDVEALAVLPAAEEDRLRFMFIERKCADVGLELRVEDVGHGYSYTAVHAVLLSAMRSFAEELVRCALATKLRATREGQALPSVWIGSRGDGPRPQHVWAAVRSEPRLQLLSRRGLGTRPSQPHAL